jgi:hypothetical protein
MGYGQDSPGMGCGFAERGIKPDLIIFADVGCERAETYAFKEIYDDWAEREWGIRPVTVRYQPKDFKHWPPYHTLLENCLTNVTLPSLAYGYHTCSSKWKIAAINAYIGTLSWAREWWAEGGKLLKAIGFDDSPHERRRAERGCNTFAIQADKADKYELWFPLQQWGWTREHCVAALKRHGLPVPPKSSCFFCPAMKPAEVDTLATCQLQIIVVIEARTRQRHLNHAASKGWPRGEGVPLCEGLWRRAVKGCRGATAKPGSMTEYIRQHGLLPAYEVDRLITATPSEPFTQADFERMGFTNWTEWLASIITPVQQQLAA